MILISSLADNLFYFLIQIFTNSLGIYIASELVGGFSFQGDFTSLILAGFLFGLLNFFLRPVLKILSFPLLVLTLGLFTIIINVFMVWLLSQLMDELVFSGFWSYFWVSVILSAVNVFVHSFISNKKRKR